MPASFRDSSSCSGSVLEMALGEAIRDGVHFFEAPVFSLEVGICLLETGDFLGGRLEAGVQVVARLTFFHVLRPGSRF